MESLVHTMLSNALAATVLGVLVAGLGRTCRRPALIHGLWLVVLIKLVTPPVVPVSLPVAVAVAPAGPRAAEADSNRDRGSAGTRPELKAGATGRLPIDPELAVLDSTVLDPETGAERGHFVDTPSEEPRVASILPAAWKWEHLALSLILAGALGWWVLAAVRIVRFQRVLRDVRPVPEEWQAQADELATRLGLDRRPAVRLVPGRVPPMLWAIGGRPQLLVPSQLWVTMSADERTSLLLHELAHLRRRDHWVRWLELIVGGLYWWLPAVWWIRRSLRDAEEQCCDAWVVWAMPQGAKTYAAALLAAVEFVSGARTAPAAASATSGNGHVSCLKRRLRMIVRAKTPKGLSWAGRLAVMGMAALLLPLAPSWAQKDNSKTPPAGLDRLITVNDSKANVELALAQDRDQQGPQAKGAEILETLVDQLETLIREGLNSKDLNSDEQLENRINDQLMKDPDVVARRRQIQETREQVDRAKKLARQPNDPARRAAERQLKKLTEQLTELLNIKDKELRARLSQDDDKDDHAKKDKDRDGAEPLEDQVKDLIDKLGKELGPVGEEIRKALEQAVREVHQSLEKEGVSVEDLRRALEKSHEKLRGAVEKGGPVNEEMRKAMERSRKDMREGAERAREEMQESMRNRLEAVRQRQRELVKEGRSNRERPEAEPEKSAAKDRDGQPNRDELDTARMEIRELEQQLRRATRRLEQLERRESLRNAAPRRLGSPRAESAPPQDPTAPRAETAPTPRSPVAPATPARPAVPRAQQPQRPNRPPAPGGGGRRAPQSDYEQRFRELDDKLNRLLKELENLKGDKKPAESREPSTRGARPSKLDVASPF